MQYTPGEWKPEKYKNNWLVVSEQMGKTVEVCRTTSPEPDDAYLLSAAPEMREALVEMGKVLYRAIDMIDVNSAAGQDNLKFLRDAMNKCMKALNKTEGR